jgi:hypothetical protein
VALDSGKSVNITRTNFSFYNAGNQCFTRRTFPLRLAYAMTAHSAQGATISSRLIVHVRDAFVPGIMYVIASRVTERRLLSFVDKIPEPQQWRPVLLPPHN